MNMRVLLWSLLVLLTLTACGGAIAAGEIEATPALPTPLPQFPPDDCPVTPYQDPAFVPPKPYPPAAPYGEFWYGNNELWTMLRPDGRWNSSPDTNKGYVQKVLWFREGFDMMKEEQPLITVSGRRLDGDSPPFEEIGGTNGHHADVGQFMLTGIVVPTAGCWEITGHYREETLSFVVWVAP